MSNIDSGGLSFGPNSPPEIVAEIGMNHNGDRELAMEMVEAAADAGADAVKFQTFTTEKFLAPSVSGREERKQYELGREDHDELQSLAHSLGIEFLSTPFDSESAELLNDLGVPAFKIASSDLTNTPLLKDVAGRGKPVLLSTGYSKLSEVATAVETIEETGNDQLVLLHCVSSYPTPLEEMNLNKIRSLRRTFDVPVGLSDHSKHSPVAPTVATAFGASVIEKHFTTDNELPGYDHEMSENPETFGRMVEQVNSAWNALGTGAIAPTEAEQAKLPSSRRSLYWTDSLSSGTTIERGMLRPMRPGGEGIPPERQAELVGASVGRDVTEGEPVRPADVDWGSS